MSALAGLVLLCAAASVIAGSPEAAVVASMQEDGLFDAKSLIWYENPLPPESSWLGRQFALCLWVSLNYLRGENTVFLSYASTLTTMQGAFKHDKRGNKKLEFCVTELLCVEMQLEDFSFQRFHHICLMSRANGGQRISRLFYDGEFQQEERVTDLTNWNASSSTSGILVLGQSQTSDGFGDGGGFSGKIAQLILMGEAMDEATVKNLSQCQQQQLNSFVSWSPGLPDWELNNVSVINSSPCSWDESLSVTSFPHAIDLTALRTFCHALGGHLPVVASQSDYDKLYERTSSMLDESKCPSSSSSSGVQFWLGSVNVNGGWVDPYTGLSLQWPNLTAADALIAQGPQSAKGTWAEWDVSCGICIGIGGGRRLRLKGLNQAKDFDTEYYVHGMVNDRMHFKGLQNSHIYMDKNARWRLQSFRSPAANFLLSPDVKYPIGRHQWLQQSGSASPLLSLSICYPDMFTCDSGECVPLSSRCDTIASCGDGSDELDCSYLQLASGYNKEIIPRGDNGRVPLPVFMEVTILAFPAIETVALKVTVDFQLNLRWYDDRLSFRDLNDINSLSLEEMGMLWTPNLAFTNALGPYQTEVDQLTSGLLLLEGDPLKEDVSLEREARIFAGANNSVNLKREYYLDYACNFDLVYYPFDTQVCKMEFAAQLWPMDYLELHKDGNGVTYQGLRKLVEYEIQMEVLQLSPLNNLSRGIVKVIFRRRMEYHVTNIFLQTFILVIVGFLSFFFRVDNFTDRIMVTLTVMLVVATIMSTIQQALPKTSYYKLIDYWLMFILNILTFMMGFHTYIQYKIKEDKDELFLGHLLRQLPQQRNAPKEEGEVNTNGWIGDSAGSPNSEVNKNAEKANKIGIYLFLVINLAFNFIFWPIAIHEYLKSADNYLTSEN